MILKFIKVPALASLAMLLSILPLTVAGENKDVAKSHYQVIDGKVDQATYIGWRVFHSACYGCHGVDATGTSVAPNLVERISDIKAEEFVDKVLERYRIVMPASDVRGDDSTAIRQAFLEQVLKYERGELIMPTWRKDPNVRPHVLDIYGYLKARSDGELGPGRPERME